MRYNLDLRRPCLSKFKMLTTKNVFFLPLLWAYLAWKSYAKTNIMFWVLSDLTDQWSWTGLFKSVISESLHWVQTDPDWLRLMSVSTVHVQVLVQTGRPPGHRPGALTSLVPLLGQNVLPDLLLARLPAQPQSLPALLLVLTQHVLRHRAPPPLQGPGVVGRVPRYTRGGDLIRSKFLVANSHSSNSSSWSVCLSVCWMVPSCDNIFIWYIKLSETFTFKTFVHLVPSVLKYFHFHSNVFNDQWKV